MVHGTVVGVLGVALFGPRAWSAAAGRCWKPQSTAWDSAWSAPSSSSTGSRGSCQGSFAAFTEAVGTQTDVLASPSRPRGAAQPLPAGQRRVLRARRRTVEGPAPDRRPARGRDRADSRRPAVAEPHDRPDAAAAEVVFIDAWNLQRQELESTEEYGKVGNYPLTSGERCGACSPSACGNAALECALQGAGAVRGPRADAGPGAQRQRPADAGAERRAAGRTRALEGFAELTRDLGLSGARHPDPAGHGAGARAAASRVRRLLADSGWAVARHRPGRRSGQARAAGRHAAGLAAGQTPSLDEP